MSVVVDLPLEAEQAIIFLATQRNISQENLIKEMILAYLEDLEDAKIGEEAYNEYLASGKKGISAKKLYEQLEI